MIVGGGFGGLQCAKALRGEPVDVVLVDRRDYHLFTPLLYQVASCLLNPSEIAAPLRKVFRGAPNVRFRQGEVVHVDLDAQRRHARRRRRVLDYDYCVLATGSVTNYYGNDAVARARARAEGPRRGAPAPQPRARVPRARRDRDRRRRARRRLLTFCIVGGGPDRRRVRGRARRVRPPRAARTSTRSSASDACASCCSKGATACSRRSSRACRQYARRELERRGVDVRTGTLVAAADDDGVVLHDGTEIATSTMVWTAGVRRATVDASRHARRARIEVDDHFRVVGARRRVRDRRRRRRRATGTATCCRCCRRPRCRPAATSPARSCAAPAAGRSATATRARWRRSAGRAAVGQVGPLTFTGFLGWIVWLVVHLYYLIGFENRSGC